MGPTLCPFIIQLKNSSSVLEIKLVKKTHKRPKTLAGPRKSKRRNLEDTKGDFNLGAYFSVEYKLSMLSAQLEQMAKKIHQVCL